MGGQDLLRHFGYAFARSGVGLHPPVVLHHSRAEPARRPGRDQPFHKEIALQNRVLHWRAGHHPTEDLRAQHIRPPEPGIAQPAPADPTGPLDGDRHADRTTPVLAHGQVAVQTEMVDEFAHHAGMFVDLVTETRRALRQAEAEVIQSYAPEAVSQRDDDVAVQEAPRRIAVAEQDRRSVSLVDVVEPTL